MGCETSMLDSGGDTGRADSTGSEEDNKLQLHKFIERQRGDVFQLYHFSKVVSRGSSIVRQVVERHSRVIRSCKIRLASQQVNLLRGLQEVEVLKHLSHPNIVQLVEYFSEQGFLYLMLEHLPGHSLGQLDPEDLSRLHSLSVVIEVLRQLLLALRFCHKLGYAHKAINPEHVMLIPMGQSFLVKLVGFGNAHRIGAPPIPRSFAQSTFTAPEAHKDHNADKQDIWGCGLILIQLLSGQRNFGNFPQLKEPMIMDLLEQQQLQEQQKSIITDFLLKALEADPNLRFTSEQALMHQIFSMTPKTEVKLPNEAKILQRLMHYRVQASLKSLFWLYGSINIFSVAEKVENLVEFYNLDKNKDGKIDFEELVEGFQNTFSMEPEAARLAAAPVFQHFGKDLGESIQYHQFVAATAFVRKDVCEKTLEKIFQELDTNNDKIISLDELEGSIEGVNLAPLFKPLKRKQLTFPEFRSLMTDLYYQEQNSN